MGFAYAWEVVHRLRMLPIQAALRLKAILFCSGRRGAVAKVASMQYWVVLFLFV
jgi:hypothetical protein